MASNEIVTKVQIHPLSRKPDLAWQEIRKAQQKKKLNPLPLNTPIYSDKVRFVCLSDTHSRKLKPDYVIPPGDVLLHAGDFTKVGNLNEVIKFNAFLGTLPHPYKVVISGNHEACMDKEINLSNSKIGESALTNCIYLLDSSVTIFGIKIYGSPWTPPHCTRAFVRYRGHASLTQWNLIPDDVDILMTHGPPIGYGDRINAGYRVGCTELLSVVQQKIKPKVHLFGHVHEDYGIWTDGCTKFINASTCDKSYRPIQPPVIFDLPLPEGFSKLLLENDNNNTDIRQFNSIENQRDGEFRSVQLIENLSLTDTNSDHVLTGQQ